MTPRTWQLLRLLADGAFHSGEELGEALGISRATVFSSLAQVADFGVQLQRVRGRGYRLAGGWDCLERGQILDALSADAGRFDLEILQQAGSSNTELLKRAAQGAAAGSVLAVELQTAGRGRIGRVWHTGLGNALTFSLLWRFERGLHALSGLSLAVGLAICRALKRVDAAGVALKWPNDILAGNSKLGGVLIEAQGDMYGPSSVVIGIGINCTLPHKIMQSIDQRAISLDRLCVAPPGRNRLFAMLLQELARVLDEFECSGFAALRAEWERNHAFQDLPVALHMPDGAVIDGINRGVGEGGELILETAQGLRQYNSGEVGVAA